MTGETLPVSVLVDGFRFEGFVRGTITLSMLEPFNTFDMEYVSDTRIVQCGQEISLMIGDHELLVGHADTVVDHDEPEALTFQVAGRSKTCDLADCTAPTRQWSNATLIKIIQDLVSPLAVDGVTTFVSYTPPAGRAVEPFDTFRVKKSETYYDAILRACNMRRFFAYADRGFLAVREVASLADPQGTVQLVRGKNVVSTVRTTSITDRYSHYLLSSQVKSTDTNHGKNASQVESTVIDEEIQNLRYRPLVVKVQTGDKLSLKAKAEWERDRRMAGSDVLEVTVVGFGTGDVFNPIWLPNMVVDYVENPAIDFARSGMIMTAVTYEFGPDNAQVAKLTLMRPKALEFLRLPQ